MTDTTPNRNQMLYSQLRDRICLLDYPPDTRLSEEALAKEFGISRTPLRRVLARLEDEGLVQSVHGVGTWSLMSISMKCNMSMTYGWNLRS